MILRVLTFAASLLAIALVLGAVADLAYEQLFWYRHGVWHILPFVQAWRWAGIDPRLLERLFGHGVGSRILQGPLWVGLIVPGIVIGWLASRLSHRLQLRKAHRIEAQRLRDAA